jgi:hypothetical protein
MGFSGHTRLYMAAHYLAGWVGLAAVDLLVYAMSGRNLASGVNSWIVDRSVWLAVLLYVLLAIFLGLFVSWMVGEVIIHSLMGGSIKGTLRLLTFIDEKTPNGTTGIIGFVFLFCGFVGQIAATVING